MTNIVGIVLAAGSAQRFGGNKLMQPLGDGVPVGVATASNMIQALPNSIVVVRPGAAAMIEAFTSLGLTIVENSLAEQGMGTSLAAGIEACSDADGWLIALADMPWVRVETIRLLVDSLCNGASMVAPFYEGHRGHPVGFSSRWGEKLQALSGDEGAKSVIATCSEELEMLNTRDAGVIKDIDYPDDLAKIK